MLPCSKHFPVLPFQSGLPGLHSLASLLLCSHFFSTHGLFSNRTTSLALVFHSPACLHVSQDLLLPAELLSSPLSVVSLSHVWLFATSWTAACQASLSFTVSWSLLKLMPIESRMPSNHLILCRLLLLLSSIVPSIRIFSNESALHITWLKYWSFSISPSNQSSGLISFRIDWFYFLAVQETLKSLLQHHNLKASILRPSAFFMVQLSHPYLTTGKTIALTIQMFVSKMMSLLFNMLTWFVIAFLPRSKCLFVSWLQSPSGLILEPKKIKSVIVSPSICHEVMRPDAMILIVLMLHLLGQNN